MLPLSISARGSSSCRLLGKLWPLPRIRREASTWTPSSFDPPRQFRAYMYSVRGIRAWGRLDFAQSVLQIKRVGAVSLCTNLSAN